MAEPRLDFLIVDTYDTHILGIADTSAYPGGFVVQSPTFFITPGDFSQTPVVFAAKSLNFYNSQHLGFCSEPELLKLPDGLYKIKMSVYPNYTKEKTILRVDTLMEKFDEAFMKLDMIECDQDLKCTQQKKLDTISNYVQCAIAAANKCANSVAVGLYHTASRLLQEFETSNLK